MRVDAETGDVRMTWQDRRAIVLHRAAFTCEECCEATATEVDHIWPRSMGGGDDLTNLRATCLSCNRKKGGTAYVKDIDRRTAGWTYELKARKAAQALLAAAEWGYIQHLIHEGRTGEAAYEARTAITVRLERANQLVFDAIADLHRAVAEDKADLERRTQEAATALQGIFSQPIGDES